MLTGNANVLCRVLSGLVGGGLAAIGALWAVKNGIRDLEATDTTSRLIPLVKKMAGKTALNVQNLSDADVRNTFMLPVANTVVQFVPVVVQADKSAAGIEGTRGAKP